MILERRYLYQGHAVGAAAHIRRYDNEPVTVDTCFEGAAALPVTGGCLFSQSGPREISHPEHGFIMSFESASGRVSGDYSDPVAAIAQTQGQQLQSRVPIRVSAEASVTNLKVQDVLTVDLLQCQLVSDDPRNHGQVRFCSPKRPQIVGVKIAGHTLNVELDDTFLNVATKQSLCEEYLTDPKFRDEYKNRFYRAKEDFDLGLVIPEIRGYLVTSIVKRLSFGDGTPKDSVIDGNKITLPGFGRLYFGELIIGENSRRLTMLRLQMGSRWGGDGCFAESRPNGEETP